VYLGLSSMKASALPSFVANNVRSALAFKPTLPWRRMFDLDSNGIDYLDTAPFSFDNAFETRASPERTFDALVDIEAEREWFPDFSHAEWMTAEPHGVGSLRDYALTYLRLTEHFVIWDRGARVAFVVTEASLPLCSAFAEDYRLTPTDDGGTRVVWRVLYTPHPRAAFLHPVLRPVFARDFRIAARQLAAYCDRIAAAE
jgi:hypothetical protein